MVFTSFAVPTPAVCVMVWAEVTDVAVCAVSETTAPAGPLTQGLFGSGDAVQAVAATGIQTSVDRLPYSTPTCAMPEPSPLMPPRNVSAGTVRPTSPSCVGDRIQGLSALGSVTGGSVKDAALPSGVVYGNWAWNSTVTSEANPST